MKFAEHLAAHITPEWRKQYIQYEALKEMLYAAVDQAPSIEELSNNRAPKEMETQQQVVAEQLKI